MLLVFYVTCNNISVIYVTAQMCRRTEDVVVPMVGLPTPYTSTFRRVLGIVRLSVIPPAFKQSAMFKVLMMIE